MTFYEALSHHYDAVFSVDAAEMAFIAERIAGGKHLLDIGCGTGNKTVHCSRAVERIHAVDLDEGMIAKATQDNARPNIRYEVLDMRRLNDRFTGETFDRALCLGNTLVHLSGPEAIRAFLADLHGLLRPGAVFVVQILNYDRILDRHIEELPPLETPEVLFTRRYRHDGDKLHFMTTLFLKQDGVSFDNDVPLYPLRKQELDGLLAETGFSRADWYGSYKGDPYGPDSFPAIAVCGRQALSSNY